MSVTNLILDAGLPQGDAPFVQTWGGLLSIFMTTGGAIILALIHRNNKKAAVVVSEKLDHVSNAVNNVQLGEPTLVQKVTTISERLGKTEDNLHDYQEWMGEAVHTIGKELGVNIPPYKIKDKV